MAFLHSISRTVRTQLGFALLFILLGAGNIIFGSVKAHEYRDILSKAVHTNAREDIESPENSKERPNDERSSTYLSQIKGRIEFYVFVMAGGKWILGVSGFFLLLALVGMKEQGDIDNTQ